MALYLIHIFFTKNYKMREYFGLFGCNEFPYVLYYSGKRIIVLKNTNKLITSF